MARCSRHQRVCTEPIGRVVNQSQLTVSDLLTAPCGDIDESADVDRSGGIGSHIWSTIYLTVRGALPSEEGTIFVPVVTPGDSSTMVGKPRESRLIRIEMAGAVVHAERGVDPDFLTDVLRAVKAAA